MLRLDSRPANPGSRLCDQHRRWPLTAEGDDRSMLASLAAARAAVELAALRWGIVDDDEAGEQLLRFEREHDGQRLLCTFQSSEAAGALSASDAVFGLVRRGVPG